MSPVYHRSPLAILSDRTPLRKLLMILLEGLAISRPTAGYIVEGSEGVNRPSLSSQLEMEVGSHSIARVAYLAYDLASFNELAGEDVDGSAVSVDRHGFVGVDDHEQVAVAPHSVVAVGHDAIGDRMNRCSLVGIDVETLVKASTGSPRKVSEASRELTTFDGPDQSFRAFAVDGLDPLRARGFDHEG